jgi:tRNA threonylcarbamoyladenosine biosynthesis protein TsaB
VIVLGVESSTARSSVVLLVDDEVVAHEHHLDARGHGAFLAPAMQRCLVAGSAGGAGVIDAVAVGIGPGLFTGLRVGIATAGAFASARGLPIVGVGGMDALALGSGVRDRTVVTTLDARRGQVFWAVHAARDGALERVAGPVVGTRAELDALLADLAGEGTVEVVGEVAVDVVQHPDAADTARLARAVVAAGPAGGLVPAALTPIYLRDADVRIGWAERGGVRGGAPAADGAS